MTRDEFLAYLKSRCEQMIQIVERKNHDYTGSEDPFANFRACEALGICSAEAGILVRRVDKLKRVITFIQKGVLKVTDESVEDTLLDDANYSLILAALIHSKRMAQTKKAPLADLISITVNGVECGKLEKRASEWVLHLTGDKNMNWVSEDLKYLQNRLDMKFDEIGISKGWPEP